MIVIISYAPIIMFLIGISFYIIYLFRIIFCNIILQYKCNYYIRENQSGSHHGEIETTADHRWTCEKVFIKMHAHSVFTFTALYIVRNFCNVTKKQRFPFDIQ